jgi:glycosyltransferase XagB
MPVLTLPRQDQEARLDQSRDLLSDYVPELSSRTLLSRGQKVFLSLVVVSVVIGLLVSPLGTGIVLVGVATALYLAILASRVAMILRSLRSPYLVEVSDVEARAIADGDLPVYTLLVPLYREAHVVARLLAHLRTLDYPADRLDVKLLLERRDDATVAAVLTHAPGEFDVVVVPEGAPFTKPRALNYGLTLAKGEIVTIYDAEDRPDPLQLRKAATSFRRLPPEVGCLQAKLDYWNSRQNLITRWFGIEYVQWFRLLLPGLAASGSPVPLGGTSNHVRRDLLDSIGGWDPYNVTEDADLGIRLHRAGFRSAVLDSVTWEEANSDYVNWNNQRSRWYKGYVQTWLVHMRHPLVLLKQLGWRGWFEFNTFVGGTPVLSLLNLVFWALTVAWFAGHVNAVNSLFPPLLYYPALISFCFGNVVLAYLYVISARLAARSSLVPAACLVPLYWLMMGIASLKALWQLVFARSFWEKTVHGLAGDDEHFEHWNGEHTSRPVPGPEFVPLAHPVLAERIVSAAPGTRRSSTEWLSLSGRWCQTIGLALLVFVLYVVVLSGFVSSGAPTRNLVDGPLSLTPANGSTLALVTAPEAGISELVVQGTSPDDLNRYLGHLDGSALPGAPGDAVVVGHNIAYQRSLSRLVDVQVGDDVTVRVGGGQAVYRVATTHVQSGSQLALTSLGGSHLTIVTSAGGLSIGRFLVVQAGLVFERGVQFTGASRPPARRIDLPGTDGGSLLVAFLWLAVIVSGVELWRYFLRQGRPSWNMALLVLVLVFAVLEMCLFGGHALPVTL